MSPQRYKLMMSYLPGMASIVNSFQSPDVQKSVFDSLMEALNVKMESETAGSGVVASARTCTPVSAPRLNAASRSGRLSDSAVLATADDHAHDLAEGDSIHSTAERMEALP